MRNIVRILAVVLVLTVVSACGSTGKGHGADQGSQGATASEESADSSGSVVTSVTLHRTGGLKPMTVDRVFSAGEPPPSGYDDADVNTVMAAARAFVAADEDVSPVPRDTCCDRYTYRVTLGYADGTSKSFTAVDGVRQPKAFELLLRAVA